MPDFETYECRNCGEAFKAHPSSRAAEDGSVVPVPDEFRVTALRYSLGE